ncbi:TetR/AcrR family transcriptional regulator [Staphylococcus saprophyticus]
MVKTRKTINDRFYELFEQKDFDKITVKDITEHAQIGRKTFYLHYIDKYDLLDRIVGKTKRSKKFVKPKKNSVCNRVLKFGLRFLKKTKRFHKTFQYPIF